MNKFILSITIFFTLLVVTDSFSQNLLKRSNISTTPKYSIDETARILRSRRIGNLKLDHDDHVYKCIAISKRAGNLEGAADALVAFKTKFGDTLDDNEVKLIIRISKIDTELYADIANLSKSIGKKETTINEHFNIVYETEKGNGEYLKIGLDRAHACGYKMENDYYSAKRLKLLIDIGKISTQDRFLDIYNAMRKIGMSKRINTRSLEILYHLSQLKGDVASGISEFLYKNKWKSRKQPGKREYSVIRDMMDGNEKHYPMNDGANQSRIGDYNSDEGEYEYENRKIEEKKSPSSMVKKKSKWKPSKKVKRKPSKKVKRKPPKKVKRKSSKKVKKKSSTKKKVDKSCTLQMGS